jgi:hypothetical protein
MRPHPAITRRRKLFLLLAAPALSLIASVAHADVGGQVAVDLDLGGPMDARPLALGAAGRFGWRFDLGPVWLQPEATGGYTAFVGTTCDLCVNAKRAVRVLGGARIGGSGLISGAIEPAIFGHAGYGWVWSGLDDDSNDLHLRGPAFDVGFALDVKVVRYFRFGAHGVYNAVVGRVPESSQYQGGDPPPAVKWISAGLHAGVAF